MHQNSLFWGKYFDPRQIVKREFILKYAFALFAITAATYIRILLQPLIDERLPFATFTLAVILVAWVCGAGPACLALILSTFSAAHFVIPPENSLSIEEPHERIALLVFFVVGIVSIALFSRVEYQRKLARQHAEENDCLNMKLRELDQRKDEFLSLLAHELRSPMAPIRNAIALTSKLPVDSPDHQAALQLINKHFHHLVRLVDDLLDVSRYLRGSIVLKREVIDLCECVHSAIEMTSNALAEKQHALIVDLPDRPILVYADPVRCCQIVCNLLSNSIKYTPDGGRIHVNAQVRPERIELAIQDNGLGIPDHQRKQIFEPFFQANLRQTRFASGLGLGLTIVQKLVELHGGQIHVYSRGVNAGSRFSVHFPLSILRNADARPARDDSVKPTGQADVKAGEDQVCSNDCSSAPASLSSTEQPPVKILIVDDSVDTARTLSKLLEFEGLLTQVAHDGMAAIKLCRAFRPDILLLDIGLPEMDGFEVARVLRGEKCGEHLKIVAISGWGAESDKATGREAGFDVHLVKPVNMDELLPHLVSGDSSLPVSRVVL